MGVPEVLKILDETATNLIKKGEELHGEESLDYFMASTHVMNQYLYLKLSTKNENNPRR